MYNIYYFNENTKDYNDYYYVKLDDNESGNITSNKIAKACRQIETDGKYEPDKLLISVPNNNVFLEFSFNYRANLLSLLDIKNDNNFNYFRYNHCLYVSDNQKIKENDINNFICKLNGDFYSCFDEYNKYKNDKQLLKLFIDKHSSLIKLDNSFAIGNVLFLSDNINKLSMSDINGYFNHDDYYLLTNKYNKIKKYKSEIYTFNSNLTFEKSAIQLKNLLNLKNKEFYHMDFNSFSTNGEVLYNNLVFLRAEDFGIDITKYKNIFEMGLKNKKLIKALNKLEQESLNKFKTCCNNYYNNLLEDLSSKMNFINNINLSEMYIH